MSLSLDDFRSLDNWMQGLAAPPAGWLPDYTDADALVLYGAAAVAHPAAATAADAAARKDGFNAVIASVRQKFADIANLLGRIDFLTNPPPGSNLDMERQQRGNLFGYIAAAPDNVSDDDLLRQMWKAFPVQMDALFSLLKAMGLDPVAAWPQLRVLLVAYFSAANAINPPKAVFPLPPPPLADPGNIVQPLLDFLLAVVATVANLQTIFGQTLSPNQISTTCMGAGSSISLMPQSGQAPLSPAAQPTIGKWQMQVFPGPSGCNPQTISVNVNVPPDQLAAWKAQPIAWVQIWDETTGQTLNAQGVVTWTDSGYTITFTNNAGPGQLLQNGHTYRLTFFYIG